MQLVIFGCVAGPKVCPEVYYPRYFAKELRAAVESHVRALSNVLCNSNTTKKKSMQEIDKVAFLHMKLII